MAFLVTCNWKSEAPVPSLDYFKKLQDSDKNIAKNDRYKQIMTVLRTSDTTVQLCFLESVKAVFDQFLHVFQVEGPSIHVLYPSMLLFLKKMMSRILKQRAVKKKSVDELLKLDITNVDTQLKDSELEIGVPASRLWKMLETVEGRDSVTLLLGLFFMQTIGYMQKSLELNNPHIEALTCHHPEEKTKVTSVQFRKVGNSLPCVKPEELTVLTVEWWVYAETDIPKEWVNMEDGLQFIITGIKLKSVVGSQRFCVLPKMNKCALSLSHGNADNERSLSVSRKTLSKERTSLSITTVNGLRAIEDGIRTMDGLSNVNVSKNMLSSVKVSHRAYLEHLDTEKKKQDSQKRKKLLASEKQKQKRKKVKKMQKEELSKIESLKKNKELNVRESKAE